MVRAAESELQIECHAEFFREANSAVFRNEYADRRAIGCKILAGEH
jgi:hypothetical protein